MASDLIKMMSDQGKDTLEASPIGCEKGVLVNEQVIKMDLLKAQFDDNGWEMKYQRRLEMAEKIE